ncbi:MAG: hypothetical protein AAGJ18_25965, partial [Bacteroidota bacterium]
TIKYITKRLVENTSANRFVLLQNQLYTYRRVQSLYWIKRRPSSSALLILLTFSLFSCGEPEIKLTRADRRTVDTLVNYQLDSISPILDSLCKVNEEAFVRQVADSIMAERKKKEERLRLNAFDN